MQLKMGGGIIVFTGGVGENQAMLVQMFALPSDLWGVEIDKEVNAVAVVRDCDIVGSFEG